MRVCQQCGALSTEKRWFYDERLRQQAQAQGQAKLVVCPGCRRMQDKRVDGVVMVSGGYWLAHRQDILNLIDNEAARARETNPVGRILDMKDENSKLVIMTTNERLAQRLGSVLKRAYRGTLQFQWSHQDRFVRVNWHRD